MKQITLATEGFDRYAKTTKRAEFLAQMDRVVPWGKLCALVIPLYPKAGNGRPPIELERVIRIHCLQHWFNLSDPAMEESLYDSVSMRRFAGIDLGREPVSDETTVCKFRHLLEEHDLGRRIFEEIGRHLKEMRLPGRKGYHCGRHHHQRPFLDQEHRQGARPLDASDQEGQSVVFWH